MLFFVLGILSIAPTLLWFINGRKRKPLPLPPGPKGWPIVGNLFNLPNGDMWKVYDEWCTQYDTDILYLNLAGTPVIVVNTHEVAIELLEKSFWTIFWEVCFDWRNDTLKAQQSIRAHNTMVNELMGWGSSFALMDYGVNPHISVCVPLYLLTLYIYWGIMWTVRRQHRKLFHRDFQASAVHQFNPQQVKSARTLAFKLKNSSDIMADVRYMVGEVIISVAYGLHVLPQNDPFIEAAEISLKGLLEALVPGAFFVNFIPMMKYIPHWIPGASFQQRARRWRQSVFRMQNLPFEALLKSMENGTSQPSFALRSMQSVRSGIGGIYTEENVKAVAGMIYQAGVDTILSSTLFCIWSILDYPHILKTLQEELDSVTDCNRLPNFDDEILTPYLRAFIKETLRYWTFSPLGIAHVVHTEDEYNGFRIPAESMIVPNTWKILHNPEVFHDPFTFKPERFLGADPIRDSHFDAVFGFGRRICPGRFMGYETIWIVMATMISIYDIKKAVGPDGKPINLSHDASPSLVLCPKPFQCSFTVRSVASALYSELGANAADI